MSSNTSIDKIDPSDSILVSIEATRKMLGGLARSTIYLLLNRGELSSVRIGSRRLVKKESIYQLLERQSVADKTAPQDKA